MVSPDKKLRLMEEEMNRFEAEIAHQTLPSVPTTAIVPSLGTTNLVFQTATSFIPPQLRSAHLPVPPGTSVYVPLLQPSVPVYPTQPVPVTSAQPKPTPPVVIVSTSPATGDITPKVITAPPQMAGPVELAARAKETAKSKTVPTIDDDDDDVTRALLTAAAGVTYKWIQEPGGKKKAMATITKPPLTPVASSTSIAPVSTKITTAAQDNIAPTAPPGSLTPQLPPPPVYRAVVSQSSTAQSSTNAKKKKYIRIAAGVTWVDPTLSEWDPNDFRMFCGDLGNEVSDDTLARAFNRYPSFQKARVVRDKRTGKSRGYGFVSFSDPADFTKAMREMNGKYVGNRPIKLKRSDWRSRQLETHRKKEKERKKLGLKN